MILLDNIISNLILKYIPSLFKGGLKKFKDKEFKLEEELKIVYQEYLAYSLSKYSLIKTLLYKNEAKNLYNFYEHVKLATDSKKVIDSEDSESIFHSNKRVLVTGTGGIGKSLLMRHIFIDQIYRVNSIPIFIELKNINHINSEEFNLEKYIYEVVHDSHLNLKFDYFKYTLEKGVYTLIFDGFDEIIASHVDLLQSEIKKMVDKFPKNKFVVSSRPADQFIGWDNFIEYRMLPLDKNQALSLIKKLDYDSRVKKQFSKELKSNLFDNHESFASIPLLLTIMLMTYETGATIPNDLTEFYSQAFYALYQKHDASKSGYKRELKANLSPEEFRENLAFIALKTFFSVKISFSISDMNSYLDSHKKNYGLNFSNDNFQLDATHSVCMLFREGDMFRFSHRSFQEYFAGVGISKLKDDIQKKILVSWAEKDPNNLTHNAAFISTILSLQKDHTFSNLFIPIIEKVEDKYLSLGSDTSKMISEVFTTFSTSIREDSDGEFEHIIVFNLKNKYQTYFKSQFLIFKSINKSFETLDKKDLVGTEKLYNYIAKSEMQNIDFNKISTSENKDLVINFIDSWFIPRLNFLIEWKNEVNQRSNTKKRSYLNIIDDL